ncbi:MAG: hypothetical protein Q8M92_08245 [Candidatus Subteraquimicrobiales bacterium]|nr:hypothetical protein [Candidatus Subteraquimicrobiales bacterium]
MIEQIKDCVRKTWIYVQWKINNEKNKGYPVDKISLQKAEIVKEYKLKYSLDILVETGTYLGNMINLVIPNFCQIYSIELSKHLAINAKQRFIDFPHIHILQGNSAKVLPEILLNIKGPSLFWLDAHYSGGFTSKGETETPVISELTEILAHTIKNHVILIDDARCFGTGDYPTISEMKGIVNTLRPDLNFEVLNDVIRIYPKLRNEL